METFVLDVSKKQKAGGRVMMQFSRIIRELNNKFKNNKDPKVSKLMGTLNKQMNMLSGGAKKDEKDKNIDDLVADNKLSSDLSKMMKEVKLDDDDSDEPVPADSSSSSSSSQ